MIFEQRAFHYLATFSDALDGTERKSSIITLVAFALNRKLTTPSRLNIGAIRNGQQLPQILGPPARGGDQPTYLGRRGELEDDRKLTASETIRH